MVTICTTGPSHGRICNLACMHAPRVRIHPVICDPLYIRKKKPFSDLPPGDNSLHPVTVLCAGPCIPSLIPSRPVHLCASNNKSQRDNTPRDKAPAGRSSLKLTVLLEIHPSTTCASFSHSTSLHWLSPLHLFPRHDHGLLRLPPVPTANAVGRPPALYH